MCTPKSLRCRSNRRERLTGSGVLDLTTPTQSEGERETWEREEEEAEEQETDEEGGLRGFTELRGEMAEEGDNGPDTQQENVFVMLESASPPSGWPTLPNDRHAERSTWPDMDTTSAVQDRDTTSPVQDMDTTSSAVGAAGREQHESEPTQVEIQREEGEASRSDGEAAQDDWDTDEDWLLPADRQEQQQQQHRGQRHNWADGGGTRSWEDRRPPTRKGAACKKGRRKPPRTLLEGKKHVTNGSTQEREPSEADLRARNRSNAQAALASMSHEELAEWTTVQCLCW